MLAFLFPGQGSQIRGMGDQLFDEFPDLVRLADEILGYSIKTLCLEDPELQLSQTQYTQPALYVVNALSYLKKIQQTQQKPDFVAGHSLGEYNALFAADVFNFATGLTLVKKRGELMSEATGGSMAAIIGLHEHVINEILQQNHLTNITIANYNSYTQFVISGPKIAIEHAQQVFKNVDAASFIPLKVSGAFHSPYMLSAQQRYTEFLSNFAFAVPTIPVIANVNTTAYHPLVTQTNLAMQITYPVKWTASIEYLLAQQNTIFEEIGPGNVLQGLIRRIKNAQ